MRLALPTRRVRPNVLCGLARHANRRPDHCPRGKSQRRRGGRVVECTALEMRHTGNRIGGSNPSLSATIYKLNLQSQLLGIGQFCRSWRGYP
jgi:hypothetical protein